MGPAGVTGDYRGTGAAWVASDGNTAIAGGNGGGVWVFTRSGNTWTQQGSTLVGTGAVGYVFESESVALSSDGSTALVGDPYDNSEKGAVWVFVS